ncbi:uncharacterized protein LOC117342493 [Pecten maximus]|uniref:uncharacterized protein LOC117342493 n=1 Tax=Pecten maximus TaxID=6579 RepID=UPI001458F09E|nr:uncharacterized protein LOC117342493 [Pecten maximus]
MADSGDNWNPTGKSPPNCWLPPINDDSVWCGVEDKELKKFYDENVNIRGVSFQEVQVKIDQLLKSLYEELKHAESTHPFLRLKPFLKQGGSREGLKVGAANEFDALLPFTFVGITSDIKEAPKNDLPPGLAEICITKISNKVAIRPAELFVERDGKKFVSSQVFHDKLFKSLIDTAVQKFNQDPSLKSYSIRRQASAPAIKLDVMINGQMVSIDVVPGFEIPASSPSLRKFVVTRWIPSSKNVTRAVRIPNPATVWRVSHSHFEMNIFDKWGVENITGKRLVRAARILKGLRVKDKERNSSSQLHFVLTSYHIKNILLHSLLCLTKVKSVSLSSVTEALGYLIFMLKSALDRNKLPQFFSFNPSLGAYFPQYKFHERSTPLVNLFEERSEGEIQQMRADLTKALNHFNLQKLLDRTPGVDTNAIRPFLATLEAWILKHNGLHSLEVPNSGHSPSYGRDRNALCDLKVEGQYNFKRDDYWNPTGTSPPNCWLPPSNDDSVWYGMEDRKLKIFYDENVHIRGVSFQEVQVKIDQLLRSLYEELKRAESTYPFLSLKPFLKQGGSREGLKVGAANEFDALLPFTFVGITSEIIAAPENDLPPGLAEICITKISKNVAIRPANLFVERYGKTIVSSQVFHDKLFKSLIDTVVQKFNQDPSLKSYSIRRQASAPAIKLDVMLNGQMVSIDVVPGFEIPAFSPSLRKFVVTRWIPSSKNVTRAVRIPDPATVWRVSHSHFEMNIFDKWGVENITGKRLVRAARILKGLRVKDKERNCSSQLHFVLTSYHIKNILLYSLLCLTKVKSVSLSSVTEALGYLIFMLKSALDRNKLPQFFSFNPSLSAYFPQYRFHESSTPLVNLFEERSEGEIQQMRADLMKALNHFNIQNLLDRAPGVNTSAIRPFLDIVEA